VTVQNRRENIASAADAVGKIDGFTVAVAKMRGTDQLVSGAGHEEPASFGADAWRCTPNGVDGECTQLAVRPGGLAGYLVERATVAFDDTISDLRQPDILENDGPAISAFEGQRAAGPDRLSACDLKDDAPSKPG
jgi:hypothetical protein